MLGESLEIQWIFVNLFLSLEEKTYVLNDMNTGKTELKNNQQHKNIILIYESTPALPASNLELASVSQWLIKALLARIS